MRGFAPNGKKTWEPCPECGLDAEVEHGREMDGERDLGPMHFWHCEECGDDMYIVGYDCELCALPNKSLNPTT
ncbi:MAG: hypothetical protein DRQ02_01365 [Candidatus Latescibacterota bacterium]|nr:MAG: hypothetical protein DRQ02_01365 [Candidatus Latescibacterota bacterium]